VTASVNAARVPVPRAAWAIQEMRRCMERVSQFLLLRWRQSLSRQNAPRVLAFVPQGRNRLMIEAVSSEAGWTLTISDTLAAIARSTDEIAPVILFDRDLWPGMWREAVGLLTRRSPRPHLILLSPNSDGNLWDELQRVGGSDILRTPIDQEDALRAVERTWSLWRSQRQLRTSRVSR
jgi:hypothetical protein